MLAPAATRPDAVFSHIPHDYQIRGMGLKAAMQQLHQERGMQHDWPQSRRPISSQAVLHSEALGVAHHLRPQAFYMAGMQQEQPAQQQHQQQQQRYTSDVLHTERGLLQRPSRGTLWQQREQQEQPLPPGVSGPMPQQQPAAAAAQLSPAGASLQQQQEQLSADIAASTTLQQLLQLFPQIAAAGLPQLTTLLLLQAVRVVRSSRSCWLISFNSGPGVATTTNSSTGDSLLEQSLGTPEPHSQQQQQQQQQQVSDPELQRLLLNANVLLDRQSSMLQFQHLSGVIWAWSQLGWRPAHGKSPGISLRTLLRRLLECPVGRETSGAHAAVGPQLARATVGCATLHIQDPLVWGKLYSIIQAAAPALNPRELALCAWGLARSGVRRTPSCLAAWSVLLSQAEVLTQSGSNFDRVGSLNLSWAMVHAGVSYLAPAGLFGSLLQQALGAGYHSWTEQQEDVDSSQQQQLLLQQQQQQTCHAGEAAAAAAAAAAAVAAAGSSLTGLSAPELSCLLWTLSSAATQQQELVASRKWQQLKQQQQRADTSNKPGSQQQQRVKQQQLGSMCWSPSQQQELQDCWVQEVEQLLQDQQLRQYLAAAVADRLDQCQPRQLAQLAQAFAVLQRTGPPAAALTETEAQVLQQIWARVSDMGHSNNLQAFSLVEVSLLLQSIAAAPPQQQLEQSESAAAAAVVTAAAQRIQSAQPVELQPRNAAVLLHQLAALSRATGCQGVCGLAAAIRAAVSALLVRLVHAICQAGGVSSLRNRELVLAAAAAGQLAAAEPHPSTAGDSNGQPSNQSRALQLLLQQLSLPLAAVVPNLKLRSLANIVCAYAAVSSSPPELFGAVSDAVQRRRVLDQGSSWAMARTLSAYAAVGYVDEGLFAAVSDALTPRLQAGALQPRVLSKFASALAAAGFHDAAVFKAIAAALLAAAHASSKSSTAGSHSQAAADAGATAGAAAESIVTQSDSGAGDAVLPHYQARDVSSLAWALATAGYKDPEPYHVLAAAGRRLLADMDISQVASLLWGCAAVGFADHQLLAAVMQHLAPNQQQQLQEPQQQQQQQQVMLPRMLAAACAADVSALAWSFAKLQVVEPLVLSACAHHFVLHRAEYSPPDAADMAWALAWSGLHTLTLPAAAGGLQAQQQQQQQQQSDWPSDSHIVSCDDSSSSNDGSSSSKSSSSVSVSLHEVLQALLTLCAADLDQLSPQQLADVTLIAAALQAGCLADTHGQQFNTSSSTIDSNSSGSSVSSTGSGSSSSPSALSKLLWSNMLSWGAAAFNAADGSKLLLARLLGHGPTGQQAGQVREPQHSPEQQSQEQQQQQRRRKTSYQAAAAAARACGLPAKLLSSGTRALLHHNAVVCSSSFGLQVQAALAALNIKHKPCCTQHTPTAHTSGRVASAAAPAAAVAALAAEVAAAIAAGPPQDGSSRGSIWQQLSPASTAELLGHVVIEVPSAAAAQSVEVLLQLVPAGECCTALDEEIGGTAEGQIGQQQQLVRRQLSWRAAVAAHLLQGQHQYVGVLLTEQEWDSWDDQQLHKLQALIAAAVE